MSDVTPSYPLDLQFHGLGDENQLSVDYATYPALKTMASYRQQERDPVIQLWPSKRAGDTAWTDSYLRQVSALLDHFSRRGWSTPMAPATALSMPAPIRRTGSRG